MPINDPIIRGTPEWQVAQERRYQRRRRHAAICRHCPNVIAETSQDATTGVCASCLRKRRT